MTNEILQILKYDHETGVFSRPYASKKVGWINSDGYLTIACCKVTRTAHRWAWFLHYGTWPDGQIDHINGDKLDNRIQNLRLASPEINSQNQRRPMSTNKSGFLGVTKFRGKFRANISATGKHQFLGSFDTPQEAHAAYVQAKRELHAGCTL
jgi:hypothetical protein